MSAKSGKDFVATSGDILFLNDETSKTIRVQILREAYSYEKNATFNICLGNLNLA